MVPFSDHRRPRLEFYHSSWNSAQFGDAAYSLRSVQRWCLYARQEREFLNGEAWSGRSSIDCLGVQILFSLEKHPFHSAYSLSGIFNMSHTTMLNYLRYALHLKYFHLWWIPRELNEQLRATGVQKCQDLMLLLESLAANKFRTIVTGDDS
jgi:hypothetical protein